MVVVAGFVVVVVEIVAVGVKAEVEVVVVGVEAVVITLITVAWWLRYVETAVRIV